MKKLSVISMVILVVITFTTVAIAKKKPKHLPTLVSDEITACYKKVNGQLRIVNDAGQCHPSELPISWSTGPTASPISGGVLDISGGSTQWVFAGPPVIVATTASQRITGVAQATLGILSGTASFGYDLCYSAGGTDPVKSFASPNFSVGTVTSGQLALTAAGSAAPGEGIWLVGFCVLNNGANALDANDVVNGWVMITK